jgi:hypothetical protein
LNGTKTMTLTDSAQYVTFSDDESDYNDDVSNWETFVIRFGKYKGQTLASMITKGRTRGYLRYILSWPDIRPNTHRNITAALDHYNKLKREKEREEHAMKEDQVVGPSPPKLRRS